MSDGVEAEMMSKAMNGLCRCVWRMEGEYEAMEDPRFRRWLWWSMDGDVEGDERRGEKCFCMGEGG